jgi:hypothetical protein
MGCAGALHPSFEQRGLFDFFFVGVAVPDGVGVGVDLPSTAGCVVDSVGVVDREGEETFNVEDSRS